MSAAVPIRVLIVDDEPAARDTMRALLGADPDIQVVGERADGRSALEAIAVERPDVLFLDVQMPELDGLTMLSQLEPDLLPVVVFVTAYDEYALAAFDARALDYLLKPFSDERFRVALARAKSQVRQGRSGDVRRQLQRLLAGDPGTEPDAGNYRRRVLVWNDGRATLVPVQDIDWIEADGDYVRLHVGRVTHVLRQTMKEIEAQLDPRRLVRIHRSSIVNADRIRELQPYYRNEYVVVLYDGTKLKLSRGYRSQLEAALGVSI